MSINNISQGLLQCAFSLLEFIAILRFACHVPTRNAHAISITVIVLKHV